MIMEYLNDMMPQKKYTYSSLFGLMVLLLCLSCGQDNSNRWQRFKSIFDLSSTSPTLGLNGEAPIKLNIADYQNTFSKFNGINKSFYDSLLEASNGEIVWDSIHRIQTLKYTTKNNAKDSLFKVFGWHPYWMGSSFKDYNYDLLNYISWYSYDIEPSTGVNRNSNSIEKLKTEGLDLIAKAKSKNCKTLLTISNHGRDNNRIFLSNDSIQEVLIQNVLGLIQNLDLNGVDVNFENIPRSYGANMTAFVKMFSSKLKSANPEYLFSLTITSENNGQLADIESLNDHVDFFPLMAYDFHFTGSKEDGSIAPLDAPENEPSIKTTVAKYLKDGLEPSKILLGLPYYGRAWTSRNAKMNDKDAAYDNSYKYRTIMNLYEEKYNVKYDELSQSAYFLFKNENGRYHKIWFEDSTTLYKKYQWAKKMKLGGTAIWTLGYDNGRKELWENLDRTLSRDSSVFNQVLVETNASFNIAAFINEYQVPVFISAFFLILFSILGFFISLFDWKVRSLLFKNKSSRLFLVLSSFGFISFLYMIILLLKNQSIFSGSVMTLLLGMLLGGMLAYGIDYIFKQYRQRLP